MKRHEICAQVEQWLEELNKHQHIERGGNRNIQMNYQDLRGQYKQLREELAKLKAPPGLEDLDQPFSAAVPSNPPAGSSSSTAATASPSMLNQPTSTPKKSTSTTKTNSPPDTTDGCPPESASSSAHATMPPAEQQLINTSTIIVEADAPSDSSGTIENMLTDDTTHWWVEE